MELIGWIGSIALAVCGVPQAYLSYKQGHSNGLSVALLVLWFGGEIFTLIYVLPQQDWPLLFNYSCNIISLIIICWYKWKPRQV